ncbi:MAG TPA: efflux RND transporter periplasmic adaptor subunit [Vicinamibacterales bacterium]|nr:efflux RND transporter periplasmic adaptor subunit [Vicinamibacterales bacterium]
MRTDLPAGTVRVTPERQQLIGVRVEAAERSSGAVDARTVGRVATDERRIFRITAATSGWIVDAFPNSVGSLVQKNEPLATFYAREFLGAQQSYFYALDARDRFRAQNAGEAQMASTNTQLQSAIDTLQNLGMSLTQIEELAEKREKVNTIAIRAPATGFLLTRNVSPGQRFEGGTELFVIADLRRVWVLADLFQHEANFVRAGQVVLVTLTHQGREFRGRVSEVLPQFDPTTRTLKVRVEVDNADYALRPDMFVDVQFPLNLPEALTVPSDAVLDTGLRKTVFVDLGDGYFEPRSVETGWRFGDRVQIVRGLMPGERIVTSGNFLIDSETRLRAAAAGIRGQMERDLVCAMDVDVAHAKAARRTITHEGRTYYFCSDDCTKQFADSPAKFLKR